MGAASRKGENLSKRLLYAHKNKIATNAKKINSFDVAGNAFSPPLPGRGPETLCYSLFR